MKKPLYKYKKYIESLVDTLVEQDNQFILRTKDGRFFTLSPSAGKLLAELENMDIPSAPNQKEGIYGIFINNFLLPSGIYKDSRDKAPIPPKKNPYLSKNWVLLKDTYTEFFAKRLTFLLKKPVTVSLIFIILLLNIIYIHYHISNFSYGYILSYSPSEFLWTIAFICMCGLFHEFGHISACYKYSKKSGDIGIGFNFVMPVMFANVSNIYMLNREERLIVAVSGCYFQLILSTIILCFTPWHPDFNKFIIINYISLGIILIPFFRNDGYWLLNDATGRTDLLNETYNRIINFNDIKAIHIIYSFLFIVLCLLGVYSSYLFLADRGPEYINEFMNAEAMDFTLLLKSFLVFGHYIALMICGVLIIKLAFKAYIYKRRN